MGNTLIDLPRDLREKLESRFTEPLQAKGINQLIFEAESGVFHDFTSPYATPKIALRAELLKLNYPDLAQKVINGDYDDESPDDDI